MKRILLLILISFVGLSGYTQKIKKNEIDKFTKSRIIETSSEKLLNVFGTFRPHVFNCRLRKVNNSFVLPTTIIFDKESVKITENDGVYFLLDNGESIFLPSSYIGLTDRANSFDTVFNITDEQANLLKHHKIAAIRITYLGGYYDHDVQEKNQDKIMRMFEIISNAEND